jgi:predicted acyl esterase
LTDNPREQCELLPCNPESPGSYERAPNFDGYIAERDVYVPMRDGVRLCVDIYRPPTEHPLPALLAFSIYNKDIQGPDVSQSLAPQPAWAPLWTGCLEAGDTRFLTSRGYIHVIGSPRGIAKSEAGGERTWDSYDLIEWIAKQSWCDGKIGMVGISGFAAEQWHAAKQRPPALKAIFPFDPRGAYGTLGSFREEYPGGVLHFFRYLIMHFSAAHQHKGVPGPLTHEREMLWQAALQNADYRMYPQVLNVLTLKGQHYPAIFDLLVDPFEMEGSAAEIETTIGNITVPAYTGSGWYAYGYKTHLNGAQNYFRLVNSPKKLLFCGSAHLERPFHGLSAEMLRWYDHWLKDIDTGVLTEPAVRYWVTGAESWRWAEDWPPPDTRWTKFYLTSWERLRTEPFMPSSVDAAIPPDTFTQMPISQTNRVQGLRYMTGNLPTDILIAGPAVLNLFASIDQSDTNWIIILKDIGPGPHVLSAREGERELAPDIPIREVSRGWLKASNRALDENRSSPWRPWHKLTRAAATPVVIGQIERYAIEIMSSAHLFRAGHRICVEITNMDVPTGVGGATNAEYIPYHICSARTITHRIYHDAEHPSHLLLGVIPSTRSDDRAC